MKEYKPENDALEQLFRDKSDEFQIDFREEDWDALSHKLDLLDMKAAYANRIRWMAAAAFLIFSLIGYFTLQNHTRLQSLADQITESTDQLPEPETESGNIIRDPLEQPDALADEPEPIVPAETDKDQHADNGPIHNAAPERFRDFETAIAVQAQSQLPESLYRNVQLMDRFALIDSDISGSAVFDRMDDLNTVSVTTGIDYKSLALLELRDDIGFTEESSSRFSRFTIGLAVSPDVSTAGSVSGFQSPGYKLGVTAEYRVTDHISVSLGAIQTLVRYSAGDNEYNAPVYWLSGNSPEEVLAECLLIDIPLTVKLNILNYRRSRFYGTVSASSYIMQREDYRFKYGNESAGQLENWSGRTGTAHLFSNAGISIGYELDVNQKWSLRAEPFIKLPMREVGWGNVKLYSMGSLLSLNYRL